MGGDAPGEGEEGQRGENHNTSNNRSTNALHGGFVDFFEPGEDGVENEVEGETEGGDIQEDHE